MRTNPTNRNHRHIGEKFWVLQLLLVRWEKSLPQAKIAGCIFNNWIWVICNCKAGAITDHPKYRPSYLKLSKHGTANTGVIQSISNRQLIREEFRVLQLQLTGLHISLSQLKIAWIALTRRICVICKSKLHQETLGFGDLQITQNTAFAC